MLAGRTGTRSDPCVDVRAPRWAGLLVVVAAAAVVAPMTVSGPSGWRVLAGVILAALTVAAVVAGGPASVRAVVFLDIAFLLFAGGTQLGWPPAVTTVLVCALPLAALLACGRASWLRPAAPWLRVGRRPGWVVLGLALATVVLAGAALTVWTLAVAPDVSPYLAELQRFPLWLAILGVVAFALVNPIWEEALFRGVVLEELTAIWGARTAVVVQALLFGAAHWAGFPSGWVGMVMAAGWGLTLGIIRLRTAGILIPYVVHVSANAVIGVLAIVLLG